MNYTITIRDTDTKVTDILELISRGYSYEQILRMYPHLNMTDLMTAARVAMELIEKVVQLTDEVAVGGKLQVTARLGQFRTLEELRKDFPRAFEKWDTVEETDLITRYRDGDTIAEIAQKLQRTRGSVRLRLIKLGLIVDNGNTGAGRLPRGSG